jgi:hypothetical protein
MFPLCHAPSIDDAAGKKRADCLSTPQVGEFPRAPAVSASAGQCAAPRDTGGFFWFVFFHAEENEHRQRQEVK